MVTDLGSDMGVADLQSEADGSITVPLAVLDGVREQLADE